MTGQSMMIALGRLGAPVAAAADNANTRGDLLCVLATVTQPEDDTGHTATRQAPRGESAPLDELSICVSTTPQNHVSLPNPSSVRHFIP